MAPHVGRNKSRTSIPTQTPTFRRIYLKLMGFFSMRPTIQTQMRGFLLKMDMSYGEGRAMASAHRCLET